MIHGTQNKREIVERSTSYSIEVLSHVKKIKVTVYNEHIIQQLLRSSGSIGANYCEAKETFTKKDFYNKVNICKKEATETMYWLDMIAADQGKSSSIDSLRKEAYEFVKIFASMLSK